MNSLEKVGVLDRVPRTMSTTEAETPSNSAVPTIRIEPTAGLFAFNLRDLWEYRELLYFLTWRDIKVRYKQTVLGAAWAVLQPLLTIECALP